MERAFCPQTFEYNHDLISGETTGVVLHYQDPENFMAFGLEHVTGTTMKPRLMRRKDGEFASLATGSNFTLTSGDRVRVAIKDDPGNSALQKLEVYVAGTSRFSSTAIDDDWSAGLCGFYVRSGQTSTVTFDNCKIGYDNNADDDCDDAGDDVQIDDDFASNVVNLTYDNNGNMTDDGILKYVYDAWNRLAKAKRRVDAETVIATYSYDGATRRTKKVVANQGVEVVANDGGNTTVNYYFADLRHGGGVGQADAVPWNVVEERNGSGGVLRAMIWSSRNFDECILVESNGDPSASPDTNPDVTASGESGESPSDTRFFFAVDQARSTLSIAAGGSAALLERVIARPYGSVISLSGDSGDGERGATHALPPHGFGLRWHGLFEDSERHSHHNRLRSYNPSLQRFDSRDPLHYSDGMNRYLYAGARPVDRLDPLGANWCCQSVCTADEVECSLEGPTFSFVDPGKQHDAHCAIKWGENCTLVFDALSGNWHLVCLGGAIKTCDPGGVLVDLVCAGSANSCGGWLWTHFKDRECIQTRCWATGWYYFDWGPWNDSGWQKCSERLENPTQEDIDACLSSPPLGTCDKGP